MFTQFPNFDGAMPDGLSSLKMLAYLFMDSLSDVDTASECETPIER